MKSKFGATHPDMRMQLDPLGMRSSVPISGQEVEQHAGRQTERLKQKKPSDRGVQFWAYQKTRFMTPQLLMYSPCTWLVSGSCWEMVRYQQAENEQIAACRSGGTIESMKCAHICILFYIQTEVHLDSGNHSLTKLQM